MELLEWFSALSSRYSPTLKKSITPTASGNSFIAKAPRVAMVMSMFSPKKSFFMMPLTAFRTTS
ncbi:hypothetical protein BMS3Bbin06_00301 [bacterium BMS3Bbin06]|nr:hypothetical protein BMS3Bbin06_00301 [bacterium BMS3Bbin06]